MSDLPPHYIDPQNRYEVVKELGRGGMAIVYEVKDTHTLTNGAPTQRALKVATNDPTLRATSYRRIEEEYTITKALQSPRTVQVYDLGTAATGAPFFTMELLRGTPLSELIKARPKGAPFTLPEILQILTQIAEALQSVHEKGYVYADLKPANILVMEDNGQFDLRLLDFGITSKAVPFSPELTLATPSETGVMTGTSLYMSPEQVRGAPLTIRSDIYSFGILAFEVCTGEVPYQGEGLFTITASHLLAKIPSARERNVQIPRALDRLVHAMMEKLPIERFATISEVLTSLTKISPQTEGQSLLQRALNRLIGR